MSTRTGRNPRKTVIKRRTGTEAVFETGTGYDTKCVLTQIACMEAAKSVLGKELEYVSYKEGFLLFGFEGGEYLDIPLQGCVSGELGAMVYMIHGKKRAN